jgi:hypothetical protein
MGAALRDQETDGMLWVQTVHGRKLMQKQQLVEFVPRLSKGGFTHTMPFPCRAVPLRL